MGNNVRQRIHTFLENVNAMSDGIELNVGANMVNMILAVTGNATGYNLVVEAKSNDSDVYSPVSVGNMETLALSSKITANGKYERPLDGFVKIRVRLSAITGGTLTVRATVIN